MNLKKIINKLLVLESWKIGRTTDLEGALDKGQWSNITWLDVTDRFKFYADPVGRFESNGQQRILFEELNFWTNRGRIVSVGEEDFDQNPTLKIELMSGKLHFSYPTVINYQKELYLVPECHQNNQQKLFALSNDNWINHTELFKGKRILDPTIYNHNNLWYLFYTLQDNGPNTILHLATAKTIFEKWEPHPQSPFNKGEYGGRPAGPLFMYKKKLVRPAQDNRNGYGSKIILFEVKLLSDETFEEEVFSEISPPNGDYCHGTHSILVTDNYIYMDAKKHQYSIFTPLIKLVNVIRSQYGFRE